MKSYLWIHRVWAGIAIVSLLLVIGTVTGVTSFGWLEVAAFISGLICVWLVVVESHWNWPIGNLNAGCFLAMFIIDRLFANAVLQVVFITLGFWGWYMWLRKGENQEIRPIGKADNLSLYASIAFVVLSLYPIQQLLIAVDGAAPFWDTFTTVLSLAATYLLGKKFVENWYFWITADVIYIALFYDRGRTLTSILYIFFLAMAISGLLGWRKAMQNIAQQALIIEGGRTDV